MTTVFPRPYMACSLLSCLSMTVTRIVQLADGEELISYESGERQRTSTWLEDPRRGAIERRQRSISKLCTERPIGPVAS
jgi:hypothetical protein